jgi:hypothetical protein
MVNSLQQIWHIPSAQKVNDVIKIFIMKKRMIMKMLVVALILVASSNKICAQQKNNHDNRNLALVKQKYIDSLITEFSNTIYNSGYNPAFWAKCYTPTFTVLRIDIAKNGKVSKIGFSDSADSLFVAEFSKGFKPERDKQTLEKYAKAEELKGIAILIPIYYEPWVDVKYKFHFNYGTIEGLFRFNKKAYRGKSIVLPAVRIPVLSIGNS